MNTRGMIYIYIHTYSFITNLLHSYGIYGFTYLGMKRLCAHAYTYSCLKLLIVSLALVPLIIRVGSQGPQPRPHVKHHATHSPTQTHVLIVLVLSRVCDERCPFF